MLLSKPVPGLVIQYSYLWHREYLDGREEGRKDRPCAIVAATRIDEGGETRVLVLPVTHSAPGRGSFAVEIPAAVKQRLKLDESRSWVVMSEWNEFIWPGPDVRRVPSATDGSIAYGMMPPGLFKVIRQQLLALGKQNPPARVRRT